MTTFESPAMACKGRMSIILLLVIGWLLVDDLIKYPCMIDDRTSTSARTIANSEIRKPTNSLNASISKAAETITTHSEISDQRRADPIGTEQQVDVQQRVLLFLTTFESYNHFSFLRTCWPSSIAKSPLLQKADVLVFSCGHNLHFGEKRNTSLIKATFVGQNTTVHIRKNPGYQQGAIWALEEALKKGWFKGYDWVIRLNPDVIIRDDTWIRKTINDPEVDGIFVRCIFWNDTIDNVTKIHTDFSMFRPSALEGSKIIPPPYLRLNAEEVFTEKVEHILKSGRYRYLHGADYSGRHCKVRGRNSPVLHNHDYLDVCRADLAGLTKW